MAVQGIAHAGHPEDDSPPSSPPHLMSESDSESGFSGGGRDGAQDTTHSELDASHVLAELSNALEVTQQLSGEPPSLQDLMFLRDGVRAKVSEMPDVLAATRDQSLPHAARAALLEENPELDDPSLLDERDELIAYRLWSAPGAKVLGIVGAAHVDGI